VKSFFLSSLDSYYILQGELTAAGTWDEFPNGRFGDAKSPAFGVKDLWDNGLNIKVRYQPGFLDVDTTFV